MAETRTCPRCGSTLTGDVAGGVCPECLLAAALADQTRSGGTSLALSTADPLEPGSRDALPTIHRYRLLEQIGVGGMGVVYRAEQRTPVQRVVAIKLVKLGMDSSQVLARFEAERQALALMNHPNVAKVFDAGMTEQGRPYFVMEYVPGEPITEFCDRHSYTTRQRLELFIQAREAVQHAHQKAVIHRDIKPSNILVTLAEDGQPSVKVIDFGVAKATAQKLTERTLFTELGQLVGTPEYMSPEQAEMTAVDIDTRSDVYSLGVVLYELLSGALPFDPRSLRQAAFAEIQRIIREVDPPRPSTRLSSLGEEGVEIAERRQMQLSSLERELKSELEWIPLKAIRKDRAERYGSAAALAEDLRNYLEHRPLVAGPESAGYRAKKFLRRNKGPVAAVAAVVAVLIAGVVVSSALAIKLKHSADAVRAEQARTETALAETRRQKDSAEAAKSEAQAISTFTSEMLESADPDKQLGDKVTVLQAVTAAVQQLDDGRLEHQPGVEAAVRYTIGHTLFALGRYDLAEPLLLKSLELRKAMLPKDHMSIGESYRSLGWLKHYQQKFAEAEPLFREALRIHQVSKAPPIEEADCLNGLGVVLQNQGKAVEAERALQESLEFSRRNFPGPNARTATALNALGMHLFERTKYAESELLLRESLAMFREVHAGRGRRVGLGLRNIARLQVAQGKLDDAAKTFEEALQVYREALPAEHPEIGQTLRLFGALRLRQGKLDESAQLLTDALAILGKTTHAGDEVRRQLGAVRERQGRLDEAESLYREFLSIKRKQGQIDRGFEQALDAVANVLTAQGKLAEAEAIRREELEAERKLSGGDHLFVANSLNTLARLLRDQGKFAEAEAVWREALAIRRKKLAPTDPYIADSLSAIGAVLCKQKKPNDAEPLLRESLRIREVAAPPSDWAIASAESHLAEALAMQEKFEEAERLLLGACAKLNNPPAAWQPHRKAAYERIVRLYVAWGKSEKAAEWRAKSPMSAPTTTPRPNSQPAPADADPPATRNSGR